MPDTLNIQDGLISTVAELGTVRDKGASVSYVEADYQDQELVAAYRTSWLARKIVDIPAQDMFRAWRSWQAEEDQIEKIEKLEKQLGIQTKLLKAKRLARLYGECHLYFDLGDDAATPVAAERVRKGGLRFVTLLTHRQIQPGDVDQDPLSPTFGKPLWYAVVGARQGDVRIHPSRLISFIGAQRPDADEFGTLPGHRQGDSVLYALMSAVKQFDGVAANINSLVYEAKIDVISVKGLTTHIAGNPHEEAKLLARYRMAATAKGNNGMLLLDGDNETYEQKSFQFSALADIMDRYAQNSSGGADIPMTRLFGRSPGGMNATGDSDLRNYYDRISSDQELEARPALEIFDECLIRAALGARPPETHYKWSSLWQVSDKERAELGRIGVQTVKTLKDTGLIPDEVLSRGAVNLLTQDGVIPGLEAEYAQYFEEGGEEPWDQEDSPTKPGPEGPQGGGKPVEIGDKAEQPRVPKGSPNGGQWVGRAGFKQNPIPLSTYTQEKGNFDWAVRDIERQIAESDDHEEFVKAVSPGALTTTQDYVSESGRGDAQGGVFPDLGDDYGDDYPVVAVIKETGEHLLIDGNHRMAQALTKHPNDKVYAWVFEVSLPKKRVADEQPRAPKGTPNGGQWVKQGAGSGSGGMTAAQAAAVAKITTAKYTAEKLAELAKKPAKELGPYEYHMAKKYKKAMASAGEATEAPAPEKALDPDEKYGGKAGIAASVESAKTLSPETAAVILSEPTDLHPDVKAELQKKVAAKGAGETKPLAGTKSAAVAAVTTEKYTEAKLQELMQKDPKTLGPYEKHKLKQYKKALQSEKATAAAAAPKKVDLTSPQAQKDLATIGLSYHGMKAETVMKLGTGEWQPDPNKAWQVKAKADAEAYIKTGQLPTHSIKLSGAKGASSKSIEAVLDNNPPPVTNPHSAQQTHAAIVTPLSSTELSAATGYTGNAYKAINRHLRMGEAANPKILQQIENLDKAVAKTTAKEDMVVLRGVSKDAVSTWMQKNGLKEIKEGATIIDYGFVSTTRKASTASSFGGHSTSSGFGLKIRVPKGSKILPLKSISNYAHEDEFLLPRKSKFKIAAVDEDQSLLILDVVA